MNQHNILIVSPMKISKTVVQRVPIPTEVRREGKRIRYTFHEFTHTRYVSWNDTNKSIVERWKI